MFRRSHILGNEETLQEVSLLYGVSLNKLILFNNLDSVDLEPGDKIFLDPSFDFYVQSEIGGTPTNTPTKTKCCGDPCADNYEPLCHNPELNGCTDFDPDAPCECVVESPICTYNIVWCSDLNASNYNVPPQYPVGCEDLEGNHDDDHDHENEFGPHSFRGILPRFGIQLHRHYNCQNIVSMRLQRLKPQLLVSLRPQLLAQARPQLLAQADPNC